MRIIGHRGARGEAPENTLGGFRHLRRCGVLRVEFDIQVAADGELVVAHDSDLERCTNGHGRIREHDHQSLAALDAAHRGHPTWPQREGIPSLDAVLTELADFEHLQLEVKAREAEEVALVVARLPALYERHRLAGRGVCTSFNPLFLYALRQAAPHLPRGLLFEDLSDDVALQLAQELACVQIGPQETRCQSALLQRARALGLPVSTWTVNDPARMRELAALGVESIITDFPSRAQALDLAPEAEI